MSVNAVQYRRDLHRMPELDDELPDTTAYVRKVLEPLGAEIFSPIKGSVCAYFDAGADETVALRADMDALPVTECTGLFFASERPGRMHACGHDGHTAIELGLAEETARMLAAAKGSRETCSSSFSPPRRRRRRGAGSARPGSSKGTASRASSACTSGPISPRGASGRGPAR